MNTMSATLITRLLPSLQAELPRIIKFTLTGGVGFIVDYVMTVVFIALGMSAIWARLPAFLIAVAVTWLVNRSLAFKNMSRIEKTGLEGFAYLAIQSAGFLINWAVYSGLKLTEMALFGGVFIPLLCGSAAGYIFNYLNLRFFVYSRSENQETST